MAKIVYIVFAILLATTVALAEDTCSPWLGHCATSDDCCRHLTCLSYTAKCVPTGGLVIPGRDKRPIGPGPFPPGYIPA